MVKRCRWGLSRRQVGIPCSEPVSEFHHACDKVDGALILRDLVFCGKREAIPERVECEDPEHLENPPHLAAIIPWEGSYDHYRGFTYQGGMLGNGFMEFWYYKRVVLRQHGNPSSGEWDPWLNEPPTGPEKLSEQELAKNRADYFKDIKLHNLDDEFHQSRSADLKKITIPFISGANWGGQGVSGDGNFHAFEEAVSEEKWLEVHIGRHEESFYLPYALDIQRRFFDHYLKGIKNGWEREQRVILTIRHPDRFESRRENEWPLARTQWTRLYLDGTSLSWNEPSNSSSFSFEALKDAVTLESAPLDNQCEITGPLVHCIVRDAQ